MSGYLFGPSKQLECSRNFNQNLLDFGTCATSLIEMPVFYGLECEIQLGNPRKQAQMVIAVTYSERGHHLFTFSYRKVVL